MTTQVIATGFSGIGDAFFQRPFVKELYRKYDRVHLATPWPQLYWDMPNITFAEPAPHYMKLRTQCENVHRWRAKGHDMAPFPRSCDYQLRYQFSMDFLPAMERQSFPLEVFDFSFPIPSWAYNNIQPIIEQSGDQPICVVRYPHTRREWMATSRNCDTKHIDFLINAFKHEFFFVSIGYEKTGHEWNDAHCPVEHLKLTNGELEIEEIAALIKMAKVSISSPGFLTPMSIAVGARNLTIYGGFQSPEQHTDPRMDLVNYRYVAPEPFCKCHILQHDCNKDIGPARLLAAFEELL